LAHQLSQPLTTIAIRAETTRRDLIRANHSPLAIASLDEISAQSARLSDLVQNLRQLFGSKKNVPETFQLQKVTDEILDVINPALESPKIFVSTNYQGDPVVIGDRIQIQQVLINVLNNAIDAVGQIKNGRREIFIHLREKDGLAIVSVRDNGRGIKAEILPSLFDLYITTKENGLGVGLWLSKTIIERHQGRISGFNLPGGGAQFDVEIPLFRAEMDIS
jgi:C4-dicarboxylate-specific signal transduction histidine kinase